MIGLEERFSALCVRLVLAEQDRELLGQQVNARAGQLVEGQALVVALLSALETGPGLTVELRDRARAWLAAVRGADG